ncbi:MAG: 50S ribosomal protein L18 [Puniceicoccales bacterium]|jgi:large subunit ribosomal protein L18|nr:50S ribosomal protein L18 [Puniceicoccales bacterium]
MKLFEKQRLEKSRRFRIRSKVKGTLERPRLALRLSNKHMYAQCIDDTTGKTLEALSSLSKDLQEQHLKPNYSGSETFGKTFGAYLKTKGIASVVFDRSGRSYHGCVKAFAEAVRSQDIHF